MLLSNMTKRTLFAGLVCAGSLGSTWAHAEGESVVLVATAAAGDRGPIDGLIDGLDLVAAEFGVETRFVEALDPATLENQLRALAGRGTDVILGTFFAMGPAMEAVAPDFPDTKFVNIVGAPLDPVQPNVRTVGYATQDNSYLMGIFGGMMTETNKIGMVGGVPLPTTWADYNAMNAALQSVNPEGEITVAFVQSFSDAVKGKEVGAGLYAQGHDVIYTAAAAADIGVVESASESGNLIMVASPPLVEQAPDNVGFVASFEWAETVRIEVANAIGEFEPGFRVGGIVSGEIIASFSEDYIAANEGAEAARDATLEAFNMIKAGEIEVPFDLTEPSD